MAVEIWKDVPHYSGYQVSNLGNVRSLDRTILTTNNQIRYYKGHIIRPVLNPQGYNTVKMGASRPRITIHKAMQYAFNLPNGQIDHIDGCRTNNTLDNLRVTTQRENCHNLKCHRNGNLPGAVWNRFRNYWQSYIRIPNGKGKKKFLGRFNTEHEAHNAYMKACKEYEVMQ